MCGQNFPENRIILEIAAQRACVPGAALPKRARNCVLRISVPPEPHLHRQKRVRKLLFEDSMEDFIVY